jgi:hypothetical protein
MEEAAELGNYLPLFYKSPKEQEYIAFLWDAFETNYEHGKYQFAFLACHMLTRPIRNDPFVKILGLSFDRKVKSKNPGAK